MTVKELIEKLKTVDPDMEILIQHFNGDAYGFALPSLDSFNEDCVKINEHTVILDISDK